MTLEEIDSVEDFVEKFDLIEPPAQLISFLIDPLLQKFLYMKPSDSASQRIDLWLSTYLESEYQSAKLGEGSSADLSEMLRGLNRQAKYTKVCYYIRYDAWTDMVLGDITYSPVISQRIYRCMGWEYECR